MGWLSRQLRATRDLRTRLGGYLLTGGAAAVVDLCVFSLMVRGFALGIVSAATISFLVSAAANYTMTSLIVFRQTLTLKRGLSFLALAVVGLSVNVTVTSMLAAHMSFPVELAKIGGIGVAFVFNFLMNYFLVFRSKPEPNT